MKKSLIILILILSLIMFAGRAKADECPAGEVCFPFLPGLGSQWFLVVGGNAHANNKINNGVPAGRFLSENPPAGSFAGIVSYGNNSTSVAGSAFSQKPDGTAPGWNANAEFTPKIKYDTYKKRLWSKADKIGAGINLKSLNCAVCRVEGDASIANGDFNSNTLATTIILIEKTLRINKEVAVNKNKFLAFIVKENIEIDPLVSALQGVYFADGAISTGAGAGVLNAEGMFIGLGAFNLQRTGAGAPAEKFTYRPDFFINTPYDLRFSRIDWKEVSP